MLNLLDYDSGDEALVELPSRSLVKDMNECLINAQERALRIMDRLSAEFKQNGAEVQGNNFIYIILFKRQ